jgi:hypothetical protein
MRVIETDDVKTKASSYPPGAKMRLWIEQVARWLMRQVEGRHRVNDISVPANQHATTFGRRRHPRMRDQRLRDTLGNLAASHR